MFTRSKTVLTLFTVTLIAVSVIAGAFASRPTTNPAYADTSQQSNSQRFIVVTGYGAASGAPDIAFMNVGVESSAPDIATALQDNNARMDAIRAVLASNGVDEGDIRTDYFNIYQDRGYPQPMDMSSSSNESPVIYRVSHSFTVNVRDVSKVGELLGAVIEAGANSIGGVSFGIANRSSLEGEARVAALADARDRAQQLAEQLGVQLGDVLEVTEYTGNYNAPYDVAMGAGSGGGGPTISQGALNVSLSLNVKFAIQ